MRCQAEHGAVPIFSLHAATTAKLDPELPGPALSITQTKDNIEIDPRVTGSVSGAAGGAATTQGIFDCPLTGGAAGQGALGGRLNPVDTLDDPVRLIIVRTEARSRLLRLFAPHRLGALAQLFGRHMLLACCDVPEVAKGILETSRSVAVELIFHRV